MMLTQKIFVQLVDENDHPIGIAEKLEAHQKGWLHRAVSVVIYNSKGEMLLQKRAENKYHSPLLWSNACCTHPFLNEKIVEASNRRLMEEMGLNCILEHKFSFIYRAELDNHLIEHEYDHLFIGVTDQVPLINKSEVESYCYKSLEEIAHDINLRPSMYTAWFKLIIAKMNESQYAMAH